MEALNEIFVSWSGVITLDVIWGAFVWVVLFAFITAIFDRFIP
jgi:hypothetical protein